MDQNYQLTKAPTTASQLPSDDGAAWTTPSNILTDNATYSTVNYFAGGDSGATITADDFDINIPPAAVVDGVAVYIDGSQIGCYGDVILNVPGTSSKSMGALGTTYGGSNDLWGADEITAADLAAITASVSTGDVSGGDGFAQIDYVQITVFYHIELTAAPADVPTRVVHKVYSREGHYLGELPNVTTPFAFPQDINSAGSVIQLLCGKNIDGGVITEPLLTEDDEPLQTEDEQDILATIATSVIARGDSSDEVIFKNSNRVKTWVYNYWYPNGKLMFSGQINKVSFQYGGDRSAVALTILSDGLDMTNFIARGFPFAYTTDVTQTSSGDSKTIFANGGDKNAGFDAWGQSFRTGAAVSNVGAITLRLLGTAQVTVNLYDAPNGNLIGSVSRSISTAGWENPRFEFAQLIPVTPSTDYFFGVFVNPGQSILIANAPSSVYANGSLYSASYAGGSGGGSFSTATGDLYFLTAYGVPTTSTTFTSDDPVTDIASDVLADYNSRGGYIHERDFQATGLSLTYPFNMATIYDVIKKVIELSPTGYYAYVDLGSAEIDILPMSETADFTIVKGKDINQLNLTLSIEQVKNYLLFTGGEVSGTNLFREYPDASSAAFYGQRFATKTDNRVVLDATADAIGETFIEENSDEAQETSVTVLNTTMDISLLKPGKTIGFRNFGNFIDEMVLPIVRREPNFKEGFTILTLGRLPVRMNDEVQRINRELLNEQTANNPSAPS